MNTRVPEEILMETSQCPHGFACLENRKPLCSANYVDGKNMIFLETRSYSGCTYRIAYADRQICRCPTHHCLLCQNHQEAID